jgi:hypothetical protein
MTLPYLLDYLVSKYDSAEMSAMRQKQREYMVANNHVDGQSGKRVYKLCKKEAGIGE